MGVYIKGMEMPTARDTLVLVKTDGTAIVYEDEAYVTTAVPVPPHGRLIDADEFLKKIRPDREEDNHSGCTFAVVKDLMRKHIKRAPTIIPAEPPKEEQ